MVTCLSNFLEDIPVHNRSIKKRSYSKRKLYKLHGHFWSIGFNSPKAAKPLQRDSLLFTAKSPEIPNTYLMNLGRMKS